MSNPCGVCRYEWSSQQKTELAGHCHLWPVEPRICQFPKLEEQKIRREMARYHGDERGEQK